MINNLYSYIITDEIKLSLYNGLIAMTSIGKYNNGDKIASIIIFGFPNSTDLSFDITEHISNFTTIKINFYEHCIIENNLFGYVFHGIKIIDISEGYKLLSFDNRNEIKKNDILFDGGIAELELSKDLNVEEKGRIIYTMVVTEPDYNTFIKYSEDINDYCGSDCSDEERNFNNNLYEGRNSNFDINIDSAVVSNNCEDISENCLVCLKISNICIICKYSYDILENNGKLCLNQKDSTIPETSSDSEYNTETNIDTEYNNSWTNTDYNNNSAGSDSETNINSEHNGFSTDSETNTDSDNNIHTTDTESSDSEINTGSENNEHKSSDIDSETSSSEFSSKINAKNNCTKDEIINNVCSGKISMQQAEEIKKEILKNYTKANIIIRTENVILQFSNLEEQKYQEEDDISNIDLGDCEQKIRFAYNIPDDESLIMCKMDIKKEGISSTYVVYEIYDPFSLTKLNLSVCNNTEIAINVPVEINSNLEILYNSLSDYGYNLFDKDDAFYHDICSRYTTINGTDILLSDRKKDFYTENLNKNESICQNGCNIKSYNSKNKKAKCNCIMDIQSESEIIDTDNLEDLFKPKFIRQNFFNTLSHSNFRVLKCYKLFFILSELSKNIGQIIMSTAFLIFIILICICCIKDSFKIHKYISFGLAEGCFLTIGASSVFLAADVFNVFLVFLLFVPFLVMSAHKLFLM